MLANVFKKLTDLGTYNNNTEDDLERPDGTLLSINSTSEEIHDRFGQKCK